MEAEYVATIIGIKTFTYKGTGKDLMNDTQGKEEGRYICTDSIWELNYGKELLPKLEDK